MKNLLLLLALLSSPACGQSESGGDPKPEIETGDETIQLNFVSLVINGTEIVLKTGDGEATDYSVTLQTLDASGDWRDSASAARGSVYRLKVVSTVE